MYYITNWLGQPPPPPAQEIQIPKFVKENAYLTAAIGLAVLKDPRCLALGAASAFCLRLISEEKISSQFKPLSERFLTLIQPALDRPMTVADMVGVSALMMFDGLAPLATWWIGLSVALLAMPKPSP